MIKIDGIAKDRHPIIRVFDYLYSGFLSIGVIFVLIGVWKFVSLNLNEFLLPSPEKAFKRAYFLILNFKENEIDVTFYRFFFGFFISSIIGITLGLIAGCFKTMRVFLRPIISILLSMPPIVWIVMALFWFGFGDVSTLFTTILVTTPLTFANTLLGVVSISKESAEVFKAYKLGFLKKLKFLYVPHLLPYILSSLSLAVAVAVKITIMAELLGSNSGIGAKIADARVMLDSVDTMAFVLIILLFSAFIEYLVIKPLSIILIPWQKELKWRWLKLEI